MSAIQSSPIHVLELNNIDIYGKHFNGFSLTNYINQHPELNLSANLLVNIKLSQDANVVSLFHHTTHQTFDNEIEKIEAILNTKNQLSVSESALVNHPLYRQANILHFHMYHNMHLPIEFLTRIPKDKQIILELHDTFWLTDNKIPMLEVFQYADTINKKFLDEQRRRVLNSIDAHLIAHSPFSIRLAQQSSATKNLPIQLINFGIDSQLFRPLNFIKLRQKYHINQDELVLMCRAQKEFKGTSYIIEALKQLHLNQPVTIITVSGTGFFDSLKNRYRILDFGTISDENHMAELLNLCDIFLAPSTEESFGFMAVEAMSCAKPVIVFDGTALPDTVNAPTIGISTKRNSAALAHAIQYLANQPRERYLRGQAGRAYVLANYTEQQYFDNYIKLYQFIAEKPRHPKSKTQSPTPPNLHDFKTALHLAQTLTPPSSIAFDYNNSVLQKELYHFNQTLYKNLQPNFLAKFKSKPHHASHFLFTRS